jgi:hypothetical protein
MLKPSLLQPPVQLCSGTLICYWVPAWPRLQHPRNNITKFNSKMFLMNFGELWSFKYVWFQVTSLWLADEPNCEPVSLGAVAPVVLLASRKTCYMSSYKSFRPSSSRPGDTLLLQTRSWILCSSARLVWRRIYEEKSEVRLLGRRWRPLRQWGWGTPIQHT